MIYESDYYTNSYLILEGVYKGMIPEATDELYAQYEASLEEYEAYLASQEMESAQASQEAAIAASADVTSAQAAYSAGESDLTVIKY
jgi:hypothetical protein